MQPYELFIGLRYTGAKRRNHFISFISLISMAGIALGIMALIVVLSVMNGFQKEVRAKLLGAASHLQIESYEKGIQDWPSVAALVGKHRRVIASAPYIDGQGMLSNSDGVRGLMIRGVDPELESKVADLGRNLRAGSMADLQPGSFGIVLGGELARAMHVRLGDPLQLITPQGSITPAGMIPRVKTFTVVGIFSAGHYEFDMNLALIHVRDAQVLYRMEDRVSGVRLRLHDLDDAPSVGREIAPTLPVNLYITDWTQQNANYFRAVEIEKRMMFIILTLIIAVAAFNLVSTLVMVVTDKHPDIAILRTLGASPASIMKIFFVQGSVIGLIGTLLGVAAGVLLALNIDTVVPFLERTFHFQVLSREVYFISELPSDLHWNEVGMIALLALGMSLIATLYPSWRASKINPAEALRYE